MAAIADSPRDGREPGFKRDAEGIGKEDGDIERCLPPEKVHGGEKRAAGEREDGVDFGDELPDGGDLCRDGNGEMRVGAALFDGTNGRGADDAIAEPIRAADKNAEGFQSSVGGKVDAAFVFREKEIWARSFPAVVNPKPVFGCLTNLVGDDGVRLGGESGDGIFGGVDLRVEDHLPTAAAGGVDGGGEDGKMGAFRKQGRERSGGGEPAEEGRPKAVIAGMLIGQNAEDTAGAKEIDRGLKTIPAVEELHARAFALLTHIGVDIRVAEFLEDGAEGRLAEVEWKDLGEDFPTAQMAEDDNGAAACANLRVDELGVFQGDAFGDGRQRHGAEFRAGEEIGAEALEVAAGEAAASAKGELIGEGEAEIMLREVPIFARQEPGEQAEDFPEGEE